MLLVLIVLQNFLTPVQSVNGMIWDKKIGEFVPIFSVPCFAAMNQVLLNQSRSLETHNFRGTVIRLSYFEMKHIIISEANGTKVTGVFGEIWNTLSELLNFTSVTIKTNEITMGAGNDDGTYSTGLLQYVYRNETDAIPRLEASITRRVAAQFTVPLWKTRPVEVKHSISRIRLDWFSSCLTGFYRARRPRSKETAKTRTALVIKKCSRIEFYTQRNLSHLPTWIIKMFAREVWYAILATFILLSFSTYLSRAVSSKIKYGEPNATLGDHIFYNFSAICGQYYLPNNFTRSSRMVDLWSGIFTLLIKTAFGALLIAYMSQTANTRPFHNMESLLKDTKYSIATVNGSVQSLWFQTSKEGIQYRIVQANRAVYFNTTRETYEAVCSSKKLFTLLLHEDLKKANGLYVCRLNPTGVVIVQLPIVFGFALNFTYKRTVDVGILKLREVGIIQLLKHRWIESKNEEDVLNTIEAIDMQQVYLILLIFLCGLLISLIILMVENITFYYSN